MLSVRMPLPKDADPFGTWWTLREAECILHGVMFMKKQNLGDSAETKTSQIADEHLLTGLLNTGSYGILDRLFSGEPHEGSEGPKMKKRRLEEQKASIKGLTRSSGNQVGEEAEKSASAGDPMEISKEP